MDVHDAGWISSIGRVPPVSVLAMPAARRQRPVTAPGAYAAALDEQLIAWSADGDRRAFDEIVVRHGSFALRAAARVAPDPVAAEDLAQEAMLKAWAQARNFDPRRAKFTTWLYRITVNLCIDARRRKQPEGLPEDFDVPDPSAGVDEAMESAERDAMIARALRNLPARQRLAMSLVYDEGMSGAAAAQIMGLSAKAVERLLARARAQLRACLSGASAAMGREIG
jgi:RNA polymerase sigma-70 factor (ECF subfamily)